MVRQRQDDRFVENYRRIEYRYNDNPMFYTVEDNRKYGY